MAARSAVAPPLTPLEAPGHLRDAFASDPLPSPRTYWAGWVRQLLRIVGRVRSESTAPVAFGFSQLDGNSRSLPNATFLPILQELDVRAREEASRQLGWGGNYSEALSMKNHPRQIDTQTALLSLMGPSPSSKHLCSQWSISMVTGALWTVGRPTGRGPAGLPTAGPVRGGLGNLMRKGAV